MPEMTDPINALVQLQLALDQRVVHLSTCEIHRDLHVIADRPNGIPRYTYAIVHSGKVQAVTLFALVDPIDGTPCFTIGYAVIENKRGKGLATEVVKKGIDELRNGLNRAGIKEFYIEAVVSVSNVPSNKLAKRLLSDSPINCTDCFSGEAALQYLKKIE